MDAEKTLEEKKMERTKNDSQKRALSHLYNEKLNEANSLFAKYYFGKK